MDSTSRPPGAARLSGWKEIAAHFGKTVRTVQRWERELGLPVRRMVTGRGETIYALVEELDSWLEASQSTRADTDALRDDETEERPEGTGQETGTLQESVSTAGGRAPGAVQASAASPPRRWLLAAALFASAILSIALIASLVGSGTLDVFDMFPGAFGSDSPASYRREGNLLTVFDAEHDRLWEHRFSYELSDADLTYNGVARPPVLFEDLEGDGRVEVLFRAAGATAATAADHTLYCFEQDGRLRFRWRFLGEKHFGETRYPAPWVISQVFVERSHSGRAVTWVVLQHSPWFPSALIRLDARGEVTGEFWSHGHIYAVAASRFRGRDVLLVGGVNNEFRSAFLAVVDPDGPSSLAPALYPEYTCRDCPDNRPLRYLLFPRRAISRETDAGGGVRRIALDRAGQALVTVDSFGARWPGDAEASEAATYYTFDENLDPIAGETGDSYRQFHRRLQLEGHFPRPYTKEDERELWPIREWNGSKFVPLPVPER